MPDAGKDPTAPRVDLDAESRGPQRSGENQPRWQGGRRLAVTVLVTTALLLAGLRQGAGSRCETAPRPRRIDQDHDRLGRGLMGLTWAFQFAGARTVAASLWKVEDQATAELMTRLYGYLGPGTSKDEALREAQLDLI